jgi:hypothetical protein
MGRRIKPTNVSEMPLPETIPSILDTRNSAHSATRTVDVMRLYKILRWEEVQSNCPFWGYEGVFFSFFGFFSCDFVVEIRMGFQLEKEIPMLMGVERYYTLRKQRGE